jgi:hypothetical protein
MNCRRTILHGAICRRATVEGRGCGRQWLCSLRPDVEGLVVRASLVALSPWGQHSGMGSVGEAELAITADECGLSRDGLYLAEGAYRVTVLEHFEGELNLLPDYLSRFASRAQQSRDQLNSLGWSSMKWRKRAQAWWRTRLEPGEGDREAQSASSAAATVRAIVEEWR